MLETRIQDEPYSYEEDGIESESLPRRCVAYWKRNWKTAVIMAAIFFSLKYALDYRDTICQAAYDAGRPLASYCPDDGEPDPPDFWDRAP